MDPEQLIRDVEKISLSFCNNKETNDIDEFDSRKITSLIETGISFPDPILSMDNDPLIFPFTVNLIQGSYGTNKSYFAAHLAAAFLNVRREPALLNIHVNGNFNYLVAYLDTERPIRDQLPAAMNQIIKIAGLQSNIVPSNFKYGSLKRYKREERLKKTKEFIRENKSCDQHMVLIIDVVTDSMKSFNDLAETNSLMDELNNITENENITVIGVIHENPDGMKKARGHVGTELVNKATTAISIGFKDDSEALILKIIKNRLAKRQKEKYLKRSEQSGTLVFLDSNEIEHLDSKAKIKLNELADFIIPILLEKECSTNELLVRIREQFNVSEKPVREALNKLVDNQQYLRERGYELSVSKGQNNIKIYTIEKKQNLFG